MGIAVNEELCERMLTLACLRFCLSLEFLKSLLLRMTLTSLLRKWRVSKSDIQIIFKFNKAPIIIITTFEILVRVVREIEYYSSNSYPSNNFT